MKRWFCVVLTLCVLMTGILATASASDLLDGLSGLLGAAADEASEDELPALDGVFDSATVDVKIGGKTVKVHQSFKEAMDKYEAFFDRYIEIMADGDVTSLEAIDYLTKYASVSAALAALDEEKMSDNDALYYADAMLRVDQKLLAVAAD